MKKSSFRNHFVLLAGIILSLALSGCQNPFLQLGSESVSHAAPGIAGVIAIPPDIEDMGVPGGEDPVLPSPLTAKVKFYLPDDTGFTTAIHTQTIVLGEEDIDWNEVFQAFDDNIDHEDLLWNYGCGDFWDLDGDILQFWNSDTPGSSYSSSRPVIDLEAECHENLDGELELNLTPFLSPKEVEVAFCYFDNSIISQMRIPIAPAYVVKFISIYYTEYNTFDPGFLDTVYEMLVTYDWGYEVGRFYPFDPDMFNIEEQESGRLLRIVPIPIDEGHGLGDGAEVGWDEWE